MLPTHLKHLMLRRQHKGGSWQPELVHNCKQLAITKPTPANLLLYISAKVSFNGFDAASIAQVELLAREANALESQALQARILSLKLDALGPKSLDSIPAPEFKYLRRYPALLNHFGKPASYSKSEKSVVDLATAFMGRIRPFSQFIQQTKCTTVAVVGNAPASVGTGLGTLIDQSDIVIRFNRINSDAKFEVDYGKKTDFRIISPSYPLSRSDITPSHIAISGNTPFSKPTKYWKRLAQIPEINYYTFSSQSWYYLTQILQAPPTAGLLCLTDLGTMGENKLRLRISGMSDARSVSSSNHYGDKGRRSTRHNWKKEALIMDELLAQHALTDIS